MNDKLFIAIICFVILLMGLVGIYFMMQHFSKKNAATDRESEDRIANKILGKIDEVLPSIEEIMQRGVELPEAPPAATEQEAESTSKYQTEEDAAVQASLAAGNGMSEEEQHLNLFATTGLMN